MAALGSSIFARTDGIPVGWSHPSLCTKGSTRYGAAPLCRFVGKLHASSPLEATFAATNVHCPDSQATLLRSNPKPSSIQGEFWPTADCSRCLVRKAHCMNRVGCDACDRDPNASAPGLVKIVNPTCRTGYPRPESAANCACVEHLGGWFITPM